MDRKRFTEHDTGNRQGDASHSDYPRYREGYRWTPQTSQGAGGYTGNPLLQSMQRYDWRGGHQQETGQDAALQKHQQETNEYVEKHGQYHQRLADNFKKAANHIEALSDKENYRSSALVLKATLDGWAHDVSLYDVSAVNNAYQQYTAEEVVKAVEAYDTASQKIQQYHFKTFPEIERITYDDVRMKWQSKFCSIQEGYNQCLEYSRLSRETFNIGQKNLDRIQSWLDDNQQEHENDPQKEKLRLFARAISFDTIRLIQNEASMRCKKYNPMRDIYSRIYKYTDQIRSDIENNHRTYETGMQAKELLDDLKRLNLKSGSILYRHRSLLTEIALKEGLE